MNIILYIFFCIVFLTFGYQASADLNDHPLNAKEQKQADALPLVHETILLWRLSSQSAIEKYLGEVPNQFGSSLIVKKHN